jgi:exosortase
MQLLQTTSRPRTARHLWFGLFSIVLLLLFERSVGALVRLSLEDYRYSQVLLIPVISASLLYIQRRKVFNSPRYSLSESVPFLIGGGALFCFAQIRSSTLNSNDHLSVVVLAILLVWMAGFMFCYGVQASQAALFPLLFLLFIVPVPTVVLDNMVLALQKGSAVMTYALFTLLGVPVLWRHFKFLLPGVEIEIAEECSGIRSSLALFITSILTGYLFLQSNWRRAWFSVMTVPVVIFKNAVRIVMISCLGVYVNPGFLHGRLHRYGGLPFSLVSLAILLPFLLALQKSEHHQGASTGTKNTVDQSAFARGSAF